MKIVIDGIKMQQGTFTNKDTGETFNYDNVVFNGRRPYTISNAAGEEAVSVKIKRELIHADMRDLESLKVLIGSKVSFDIDRVNNGVYVASCID